jgi:hypothetical protein
MDQLYQSIIILCIIPIFGAIKNLIKRKSFNILIFLRTFGVYFGIYLIGIFIIRYKFKINLFDSMLLSLLERYLMFVFKICYSYITKNYERKKFKYYKKYLIELSSGSLDKMYHIDNIDKIKNI